jgi:hypothetical protein
MLGVGFCHAQMANQPPVPQWLGLKEALEIPLLAADSSAEVRVNEPPMAKMGPWSEGLLRASI